MNIPTIVLVTFAVITASVARAGAGPITFDPTATSGAEGDVQVDSIDLLPGNSIGVGLQSSSAIGTSFLWLFQAQLGSLSSEGNEVFGDGTNGDYFTIVAGLTQDVVSATGASTFSDRLNHFEFGPSAAPDAENFFSIYHHTESADALAGSCFAGDCGGTLVLGGTILNSAFFSFLDLYPGSVALDNYEGDNWSSTSTLLGTGSLGFSVSVTFADPLYFPGFLFGVLDLSATHESPFDEVDPSGCFSSDGVVFCTQLGVPSLGPANGLGANLMLQTDMSGSIHDASPVAPVPEPTTVISLSLGLVALATRRWCQRNE